MGRSGSQDPHGVQGPHIQAYGSRKHRVHTSRSEHSHSAYEMEIHCRIGNTEFARLVQHYILQVAVALLQEINRLVMRYHLLACGYQLIPTLLEFSLEVRHFSRIRQQPCQRPRDEVTPLLALPIPRSEESNPGGPRGTGRLWSRGCEQGQAGSRGAAATGAAKARQQPGGLRPARQGERRRRPLRLPARAHGSQRTPPSAASRSRVERPRPWTRGRRRS